MKVSRVGAQMSFLKGLYPPCSHCGSLDRFYSVHLDSKVCPKCGLVGGELKKKGKGMTHEPRISSPYVKRTG